MDEAYEQLKQRALLGDLDSQQKLIRLQYRTQQPIDLISGFRYIQEIKAQFEQEKDSISLNLKRNLGTNLESLMQDFYSRFQLTEIFTKIYSKLLYLPLPDQDEYLIDFPSNYPYPTSPNAAETRVFFGYAQIFSDAFKKFERCPEHPYLSAHLDIRPSQVDLPPISPIENLIYEIAEFLMALNAVNAFLIIKRSLHCGTRRILPGRFSNSTSSGHNAGIGFFPRHLIVSDSYNSEGDYLIPYQQLNWGES